MRYRKSDATRVSMSLCTIAFALTASVLAACSSQNGVTGSAESGHIVNGHDGTMLDLDSGGLGQSVVFIQTVDGEALSRCTGTLIKPTIVLTAGHCAPPGTKPATIRVASHFLDFDPANKKDAEVVSVRAIAVNPKYIVNDDEDSFSEDLALLQLEKPLHAPLATLPSADAPLPSGLLAVGYGQADDRHSISFAEKASGKLRYTNFDSNFRMETDGRFAKMIAADAPQSSICHGDSGGPLFAVENGKSTNTLVGVTESVTPGYMSDPVFQKAMWMDGLLHSNKNTSAYFAMKPMIHDCIGGPNHFVDVRTHLDWINSAEFHLAIDAL